MPKDRGPGRNTWRGGRRRERRQHLPPVLSSPVPGSMPCFTCLRSFDPHEKPPSLIRSFSFYRWHHTGALVRHADGQKWKHWIVRERGVSVWQNGGKKMLTFPECLLHYVPNSSTSYFKKKKKNSREVSIVTFRWENQSSERLVNLPKVTQGARNGVRNRAREATLWLQSDGVSRFEVRGNIVLK